MKRNNNVGHGKMALDFQYNFIIGATAVKFNIKTAVATVIYGKLARHQARKSKATENYFAASLRSTVKSKVFTPDLTSTSRSVSFAVAYFLAIKGIKPSALTAALFCAPVM